MMTLNTYLEAIGAYFVGQSYEDETVSWYAADWNRIFPNRGTEEERHRNISNMSRLERLASEKGIELRYYDDNITDERGRAHNTTPQHWGWIPTYVVHECEVWAEDDARENLEEFAEYLINNSDSADIWGLDFESLGFEKQEEREFETGWYHREDSPHEIGKRLQERGYDYIFSIDNVEQFRTQFSVWIRAAVSEPEEP